MKKNYSGKACLWALILSGVMLSGAGTFFACASKPAIAADEEPEEVYIFEVTSPQYLVYSGKPQAISYLYTGEEQPDIVYFTSETDRAEDRRGSRSDPVKPGVYYVRLIRPAKGRNNPAKEYFAEFYILRCPVVIKAEKTQKAVYNGDPKRIQASVEPDLPLAYSYYPNLELMEAAKKSAEETHPGQNTITQTFKGYRRVDRAPSEPGTYYVWIYFPGNETYRPASADVEFIILPPVEQ